MSLIGIVEWSESAADDLKKNLNRFYQLVDDQGKQICGYLLDGVATG